MLIQIISNTMNTKTTLIVLAILVVVVFAGWYFYIMLMPDGQQAQQANNEDIQSARDASADSTSIIENDLKQVPDDSSMDNDKASLDANLQSF